jgi:hypothetical protein
MLKTWERQETVRQVKREIERAKALTGQQRDRATTSASLLLVAVRNKLTTAQTRELHREIWTI